MPVRYVILKDRRLVITTAEGRVTVDEVKAHQDQLLNDPDFNPEFDQLIDGTAITAVDMSVNDIRMAVDRKLFSSTSRRALVATRPFIYGMARMMATYLEMSKAASPASVFRDFPSALKWLGIAEDSGLI